MWARVADDSIQEIINSPKIITIGGITHPRTMFSLWTDAERKAIGILPITRASILDSEYYISQDASYAIDDDDNAVTETINKSSDKVLASVKTIQIDKAKKRCNGLLALTDWYVTRKYERSVDIPDKIIAFRAAVVAVYTAAKSAINGAANVGALVTVNSNGTGATESISVNGTASGIVSTSNNTISKNSHGFVDDETIHYDDGQDADNPIKGLISGQSYYVHSAGTNDFKLSLTPSTYGDEAVVSLTGVADGGTAHTFTSVGLLTIVKVWPNESDLAYKI